MLRALALVAIALSALASLCVLLPGTRPDHCSPGASKVSLERRSGDDPREPTGRRLDGERTTPAALTWDGIIRHPAAVDEAGLARFMAALDFQTARGLLEDVDIVQPEEERDRLRDALFRRMTQADPARAAACASQLRDATLRERSLRQVIDAWSAADAGAAATWLHGFNHLLRDELLDGVLATWSARDFEHALRWARNLPEDITKERSLVHLSYEWLERDPRRAMDFAAGLASASQQLVCTMASQWALRDPAAAAEWAQRLPDGTGRTQVIACLTAAWATQAPHDAAAFAAGLPAGDTQGAAVVSAVSGWALSEPARAAEWVAHFPAVPVREQAVAQLFAGWATADAASAAEWLLNVLDGASTDAALDTLSGAVADRYPAVALAFANAISDEALRSRRRQELERRLGRQ